MASEATSKPLAQQLAELFKETREAHHQAFIATDGRHADWPMWYAEYLHEKLTAMLGAKFSKSELIYLLVLVSKEQPLRAPGSEWTAYYAKWFMERYC
jgi:hypothetical protein